MKKLILGTLVILAMVSFSGCVNSAKITPNSLGELEVSYGQSIDVSYVDEQTISVYYEKVKLAHKEQYPTTTTCKTETLVSVKHPVSLICDITLSLKKEDGNFVLIETDKLLKTSTSYRFPNLKKGKHRRYSNYMIYKK